MQQVPITSVPNQSLSFNVDGAYWQLHIYQAIDSMCIDVARGGAPLITGSRLSVGDPVLPYSYLYEPDFGNFIFDSDVDWTAFGVECNMFYLSASEFSEYKRLRLAAS